MRSAIQGTSKAKNTKDKKKSKSKTAKSFSSRTGDDNSSIASNDSSLETQSINGIGGVEGSSLVLANDSDSELSIMKNKSKLTKQDLVNFILPTTTTLVFISLDGLQNIHPLDKRLLSYSELQCEIAKIFKKSKPMVIIQDVNGIPLLSHSFNTMGYDMIRIKEIAIKPSSVELLRSLPSNWEQVDYHESRFNQLKEQQKQSSSPYRNNGTISSSSSYDDNNNKNNHNNRKKPSDGYNFNFDD